MTPPLRFRLESSDTETPVFLGRESGLEVGRPQRLRVREDHLRCVGVTRTWKGNAKLYNADDAATKVLEQTNSQAKLNNKDSKMLELCGADHYARIGKLNNQ